MKELLQSLQQRIAQINGLRYIDEDWGQLDYYSPNMPVQYPCCLIDISSIDYSNLGQDLSKKPHQRQLAQIQVKITLANLKLSNTSLNAPQKQKDDAWLIWELLEEVHKKLHGFAPINNVSLLVRQSMNRTLRDDGLQQYEVYYKCEVNNA